MTNKDVYDVAIVGMGVAGSLACLRISTHHKNTSVIAFDTGRPPAKRRLQMSGFLGLLPMGDGKLYSNDIEKVAEILGERKTKAALTYFKKEFSKINDMKVIKDTAPSINLKKKIVKTGYDVVLNDHIQMIPKEIHLLSKNIAAVLNENKKINFQYDTEVQSIHKEKNAFIITTTEDKEYKCKKLIISVGRSGWKWASEIYEKFGIIEDNDIARFGICVEMNANLMKDFNMSNCSLLKNDIEIGPMNWHGTVLPADHGDMAISAFRGNEERWVTDKVSFSLIGHKKIADIKTKETEHLGGYQQTNRIGQLTFLQTQDRIAKEKISTFLKGGSKIRDYREYDWIKSIVNELKTIIPDITTKAYMHIPCIVPMVPKINVGSDLSTEVNNLYVAGESAGLMGILSAGLTGICVADAVCKGKNK